MRKLGSQALGLAMGIAAITTAYGQDWQPTRAVRWVVPYVPGGATDLVTRAVADPVTAALGQQFVVDNRGGASGTIAFDLVSRAAPDGYTITTAADSITILPFAFRKLSFDPRTSFAPITNMTMQPMAIAVPASSTAKSIGELIDQSKQRSGGLSYGTSGVGTSQHLCGELLKKVTGIDMTHVAYKGSGQTMIDLVSGQLQLALVGTSTVIQHHRAGRARIVATTAAKRVPALPNVPTLAESGLPQFDIYHWIGLFGPAKLPRDIIARMNSEVARALAHPTVKERLTNQGLELMPTSPEQLGQQVRDGMQRWGQLIADAKIELR